MPLDCLLLSVNEKVYISDNVSDKIDEQRLRVLLTKLLDQTDEDDEVVDDEVVDEVDHELELLLTIVQTETNHEVSLIDLAVRKPMKILQKMKTYEVKIKQKMFDMEQVLLVVSESHVSQTQINNKSLLMRIHMHTV